MKGDYYCRRRSRKGGLYGPWGGRGRADGVAQDGGAGTADGGNGWAAEAHLVHRVSAWFGQTASRDFRGMRLVHACSSTVAIAGDGVAARAAFNACTHQTSSLSMA